MGDLVAAAGPSSASQMQLRSNSGGGQGLTNGSCGGHQSSAANGSCRFDSSLNTLTKKFIDLIARAKDGILDLKTAEKELQVKKRRIYDITNVLEGVGLIEKASKNKVQWKGTALPHSEESQNNLAALRHDVNEIRELDKTLDEQIAYMRESLARLTEDPYSQARFYVTEDDIASLPCFGNDSIFAVKAPRGTTLEVPDPTDNSEWPNQPRYRILMQSTSGAIDVYLVRRPDEQQSENRSAENGERVGPSSAKPGDLGNGVATSSHSPLQKLEAVEFESELWYSHYGDISATDLYKEECPTDAMDDEAPRMTENGGEIKQE
ncbi:unnamed protein product [Ostreobium quekettii]|uniref:E2F/DP family winged-helix DNA-binding domain-containing protein n=1 Tax=Ostreobium quekettii TaxID=121088 RepID=A0A8S1JDX7_9CHLO|nr:unnamed protein product [Ostreobium quekettii]